MVTLFVWLGCDAFLSLLGWFILLRFVFSYLCKINALNSLKMLFGYVLIIVYYYNYSGKIVDLQKSVSFAVAFINKY